LPRPNADDPHQRVGIIGIGPAGLQHARAVIACGHEVVAAATRSPDSSNTEIFQRAAPGARVVNGLEALLDDDSLDALVVALPWKTTPALLPKLLAHEKPMLIEKPIGLDADSIEAALQAPDAKPDGKLIGFNRRYYGTSDRLRVRLSEGGLKAVHITISEDLGRQERAHGSEIIPHLLTFSSAHTLDLALHLLGALTIVKLYGCAEKAAAFTSINGLLETSARVPVHLALNASDPSSAGIRFLFDDHTAWALSPLEMLCIFDRYEISEISTRSKIRRYMPHVAEIVDEPVDFKPGFVAQMAAFLSGNFGPGARVGEALAAQRFIDKLRTTSGSANEVGSQS
jgi:predicted dehydrogenase